ncbi:Outer membrane protein beta-barrel domain-containing protein [Flavobacterium swingsii]|jgi:hypothetical protein|uniref:Outer membrane protein beta-barrel domain-containing protein n=1 Tax=Flavobacterium swingsii TaxID=498292 RepID=A0A1I0XL10_9FLAO|nr:porin family protein [Flavobacterium swingsii]SFB01819.1 Outer membrane protein beta-barrel domain-containing protein [Flavobacterium swingsii]
MKKLFIVAIIALFGITQTEAQVTFKPGLRGGVNFAHFTQGDPYMSYTYDIDGNYVSTSNDNDDFKAKTDFYAGFYGALHLTKYYTLQPEINYSRQGSYVESRDGNVVTRTKFDVSYLSIGILNKFTFTEKFNFHVGPTVDFVVEKTKFVNENSDDFFLFPDDNDVDLTLTAGFGYDFTKNFGLEARVKKGFISVYDFNNASPKNVVFQVGATYTFDIK